jgi:hypothetical protein
MPCSDLGSGGYYQNRASARQTPVMPTTSVITLHTTLMTKCTGGRFVQFYWEIATDLSIFPWKQQQMLPFDVAILPCTARFWSAD